MPRPTKHTTCLPALCAVGLMMAAACDEGPPSVVVNQSQCSSSAQCEAHEICTLGKCVAQGGCIPGNCGEGEFCGADGTCQSVDAACQDGGCSCEVVNKVGQVSGNSTALSHAMASGTSFSPNVVFMTGSGRILPLVPESVSVSSASFTQEGQQITATQTPGTAFLDVTTAQIHCQARLLNLGAAPQDGRLRLSVFDRSVGGAIAGAQVLVTQGSGVTDVGQAPPTDANGVTETALPVVGSFTVSVFAKGYDYLSVVGLDAAESVDLALPLSPLAVPEGGYTGTVDFSVYEKQVLDSTSQPLRFGLTGASGSLANVIGTQFSLNSLNSLYDPTNPCDAATPGCLQLSLGVGDAKLGLLLPGPLVLQARQLPQGTLASKPFFNTSVAAGRRLPYLFGGELGLGFAATLNQRFPILLEALGDPTTDLGDTLEVMAEKFVQLLPNLEMGLSGSVTLSPVAATTWDAFTGSFGQGTPPAGVIRMDASPGNLPAFQLNQRIASFTDMPVADFPAGSGLDTLFVLTGVQASGFGFVPLGVGFGLDCTQGNCLGPDGPFDSKINGLQLVADGEPWPDARPRSTQDGHLAFYQAPPFGGLESQAPLTVAMAVSLQTLRDGTLVSGVVLPTGIQAGTSNILANLTYPSVPEVSKQFISRQYLVAPLPDSPTLHWVRIDGVEGTGAPQWQVFVARGIADFTLPQAPAGFADIKAKASFSVNDMALHLEEGASLATLVADQTDGLANFAKRVRGFASRQEDSVETP